MIFGSKEHFRFLREKLKDDDYVLGFFYNLLKQQVEITVVSKRYPDAVTGVYITKAMWEDKSHMEYIYRTFKSNYKDALKSVKEAAHL